MGYTLIELLIVVVVLAIAFGLVIPTMGDSKELRLREAVRMLAADVEFAQSESIAHPDDPRALVVDFVNANRYWIAPASDTSEANAVADPVRNEPMVVQFGTGRASGTWGVVITAGSLGLDNELRFDAYGTPDQSDDATLTLQCGAATQTVRVETGTGEVTIE